MQTDIFGFDSGGERTGWRDQKISNRHRTWGVACPATDMDFLLIEMNYAVPIAGVEYKNEHTAFFEGGLSTAPLRALVELFRRAELPLFLVRYRTDFSGWIVYALNDRADHLIIKHIGRDYADAPTEAKLWISEQDYVLFLYKLRGYTTLPPEVERRLNTL